MAYRLTRKRGHVTPISIDNKIQTLSGTLLFLVTLAALVLEFVTIVSLSYQYQVTVTYPLPHGVYKLLALYDILAQ